MKNLTLITLGVVFAAALFVAPARGAEIVPLKQCIDEAYANNPMLRAARLKTDGARAMLTEARSGRLPHFSLSETMTRTDNPVYSFMSVLSQRQFTPAMMLSINDPDPITNYNTRLDLAQALYTGGMVRSGIRAALGARDAADLSLERTRQSLRFNVKSAYLRVIISHKTVEVAESALETAKAHLAVAENMLKNGMVVESDKLAAMVRMAGIEEMRLSAENQRELARAGLLMAMGVSQDRDIDVDPAELEQIEFDGKLDDFIRTAMEKRPDLLALQRAVDASEQSVRVADATRRPQLYLVGNLSLDNSAFIDNDGQSWFLGLALNQNIYDGGQSRGRAGRARASLGELRSQLDQFRQGVELEVRQAFLNVQTARKKMDVMNRAVEQADASLRIIDNRYKNGLAINVEVLAAETARTEAQTRYLGALFEFVTGVESLKLAAGVN